MVWYYTPTALTLLPFVSQSRFLKTTLELAGDFFHPIFAQPAELPFTSAISPGEQTALKEEIHPEASRHQTASVSIV